MNLPIDVIPNTTPPRFKWQQTVHTPIGPRTVENEGVLPPSLEEVVLKLVILAKRLVAENTLLKTAAIKRSTIGLGK